MKKAHIGCLGLVGLGLIACRVSVSNTPIVITNNPTVSIQLDAAGWLGDQTEIAQAIDDSEFIVYTSNIPQLKRDFSAQFQQGEGGRALLKTGGGLSAKTMVVQLAEKPYVEYVEPNVILQGSGFHTQKVPTDPLYQSNLRSGQTASYPLEMIDAPKAWDLSQGSENITVAVIDTGIDATHPDLQGRLLPGKNLRDKNNNPADTLGHGTHVAGIIAGLMNNGAGTTGLAPGVKILPLRILGPGRCESSYMCGGSQDLADAVDIAIQQKARVINFSLAAASENDVLKTAVNKALAAGIVVVAAAGNNNTSRPYYPASVPGVISVGAIDANRQKASFSNYGETLSVVAPGVDILSAALPGFCSKLGESYCFQSETQSRYAQVGGTSQAAPYVSALAALLLSRKPDLTALQVKKIIEDTATDLGQPQQFGKGVISAFKALQSLGEPPPRAERGLVIEKVRANPFFIQSDQTVQLSVAISGGQADGYGWAAGGDGQIEGNGPTVTWTAPGPGKYQIVAGVKQGNQKIYGSTSVVVFGE